MAERLRIHVVAFLAAVLVPLLAAAPGATADTGEAPSVKAYSYDGPASTYDDSATTRAAELAPSAIVLSSGVQRFVCEFSDWSYATNAIPTPSQAQGLVAEGTPVRSALQSDAFHRAPAFVVDDIAENATVFRITGGDGVQRTLVQMPGAVDDIAGRFEWIVDDLGNITHQFFVKGGSINGIPITP
jgi:hypothetical protein